MILADPESKLDYAIDWTASLAAGETITSAVWTVVGATVATPAPSHDGKVATVWLTGGVRGARALATVHIVTSQGREDERTLTVLIQDR